MVTGTTRFSSNVISCLPTPFMLLPHVNFVSFPTIYRSADERGVLHLPFTPLTKEMRIISPRTRLSNQPTSGRPSRANLTLLHVAHRRTLSNRSGVTIFTFHQAPSLVTYLAQ